MSDPQASSIVDCFGAYLTNEYEVLRNVFKHLSTEDLIISKGVCHAWQEAASLEIKDRRRIDCYFLDPSETENDAAWDIDAAIYLSSISIKPQVREGPGIVQHCYSEYGVFYKRAEEKFKQTAVAKMKKPHIANRKTRLVVRFPRWEGVTVRFVTDPCNFERSEAFMKTLLNIPNGLPVKAVVATILLHENESEYDSEKERLVNSLKSALRYLRRSHGDFAFAGCELGIEPEESFMLQLMVFCGPNIDATSMVLDETMRTRSQIFQEIENFSSNVAHSKNSVMLVFRCLGRQNVKRRYNYKPGESVVELESRALEEYFPETACLGCHGLGEFGNTYGPDSTPDPKKARSCLIQKYQYSFSTALLYINYKK